MKKYILLLAGFVFVGLISITQLASAQTTGDVDPGAGSTCFSIVNNLRYQARDASTSGEVSVLQDFLQSKGYLSSDPTGYFGLLTKTAVQKFQSDNNLLSSGYVGPLTRAKIKALTCNDSNSTSPTVTTPPTSTCSTSGFETSTGFRCGCTSTTGFSTTTGQSCAASVSQTGIVKIISPSDKEILRAGYSYNIRWTSSDPVGTVYDVYLAKVNSSNEVQGIGSTTRTAKDIDSLTWVVPYTLDNGSIYRVSFSGARASGGESGNFTVRTLPAGCTSTTGFSATTGEPCVKLPPGCTTATGFSSITGGSCAIVATDSTSSTVPVVTITASPNTGIAGVIKPVISWSATNSPTYCTSTSSGPVAVEHWNGSGATNAGVYSSTNNNIPILTVPGIYTFSMSCKNTTGEGQVSSATVTVNSTSSSTGISTGTGIIVQAGVGYPPADQPASYAQTKASASWTITSSHHSTLSSTTATGAAGYDYYPPSVTTGCDAYTLNPGAFTGYVANVFYNYTGAAGASASAPVNSSTASHCDTDIRNLRFTIIYTPVGASTTPPANFLLGVTPTTTTPSVTYSSDKSSYIAPATMYGTAVPSGFPGTITRVEFYSGVPAKLLGTVTSSPYVFSVSGVPAGTYTNGFAKAYDNLGNTATSAPISVTVVEGGTPVVSIRVLKGGTDISTATVGDFVTINWTATNMNGVTSLSACTASGDISGNAPSLPDASGTINASGSGTLDGAKMYTYTVTCKNNAGLTGTATKTVNVTSPSSASSTVTLTASPSTVNGTSGPSTTSTLTWTSNATSCSAPWTSSTAPSGTAMVTPTATTTYTINCGGGTASTTVSWGTSTLPTGTAGIIVQAGIGYPPAGSTGYAQTRASTTWTITSATHPTLSPSSSAGSIGYDYYSPTQTGGCDTYTLTPGNLDGYTAHVSYVYTGVAGSNPTASVNSNSAKHCDTDPGNLRFTIIYTSNATGANAIGALDELNTPSVPVTTSTGSSTCINLTHDLDVKAWDEKSGNTDVATLQSFLKSKGLFSADATGYFGMTTYQSVKAFQSANGIATTGVAGALTRAKIHDLTCN